MAMSRLREPSVGPERRSSSVPSTRQQRDGQQRSSTSRYEAAGTLRSDLVDARFTDSQIRMRGVAERHGRLADVGRHDRDGQPVVTDLVGEHGLQDAGPAGLGIDPDPVHDPIRLVFDQHPGHVPGEPVDGVVPLRLAQRELLFGWPSKM